MSLSRKCRACLTDTVELINWSAEISNFHDKITYIECFRQCTQLKVSDLEDVTYPQNLCYCCAAELKSAYEFIRKAQNSDKTLQLIQERLPCISQAKEEFEWVPVTSSSTVTMNTSLLHEQNEPVAETMIIGDRTVDVIEKNEIFFDQDEESAAEANEIDINDNSHSSCSLFKKEQPDCEKNTVYDSHTASTKPRRRGIHSKKVSKERTMKSIVLATLTEKGQLTCELCHKCFRNQTQLKRHIARERKTETLLCHACPRTFRDTSALHKHTLTHEENRERNFTCEQCGRKFFTQNAIQAHVKTHESDRQATFQCDQCEKSFLHKGSLKLHKKFHSGKWIECKICTKRFVRQSDLMIHSRSHSGDLPYKCHKCEKAFTQMGLLNKHLRYHDGYRYKCDVCGKEYMHQSTLIQHRKEHTGLPLKCSVCDKGFVKTSKMRRHIINVHKMENIEEIDKLIIKIKTKREYRGRILVA